MSLELLGAESIGDIFSDAGAALTSPEGKAVFAVAHPVGRAILSAFGAGAAGEAIEKLEQQAGVVDKPVTPTQQPVQKPVVPQQTQPQQSKIPGQQAPVTPQPQPMVPSHGLMVGVAVGGLAVLGLIGVILARVFK